MRTKIIATLGPSSSSPEIISKMVDEGVSAFRINFSHGEKDDWRRLAELVREIEEEKNVHLALIGDLSGPSIRLGSLREPLKLRRGERAYLIESEESEAPSTIPVPDGRILQQLGEGHILLMDDGRAAFRVEEVKGDKIVLKALTDATVSSRKTVVIQGKDLDLPAVTERDVEAVKLAAEESFDYVGLSYVRGSSDIMMLRGMLVSLGAGNTGIIAKIETPTALRKLPEIIEASDIVLVARGDLGMHFPLQEVPRLQERIVSESLRRGKPVIVATQILGSMIENPVPTRSEVVDVVTAIREGVDALMLTGETAVGRYPLETVKWLKRILETYEPSIHPPKTELPETSEIGDRFAYGITSLAESLNAVIAVYTKSGRTALRMARFRPQTPIYVASPSIEVLRKLSIIWGMNPILVGSRDYNQGLDELQEKIMSRINEGKIIVLTYGLREEPLHLVRVIQVRRS